MSSDKDNERHKAIELNEIALQNFSNYLRIQSVHPNVNYDECVYFLTRLAADIGLPTQVVNHEKKQVVIATWRGLDTSLPAVMLNSHMDVVPVEGQEWTHPPFGGEEHNGRIYGRGAQDMKSIGIQYLEAIRRLRKQGVRLQRTVHCTFVPDEEIGGAAGMKQFVKSQAFTDLNVGVALDEGLPSSNDTFFVYYGERCMCHVTFHCPGHPGHGSLLLEDIAAEKVNKLLTLILEYRERQVKLLQTNPNLTIGDVNSVNVTMISGGQQANVLPAEITITIDCRIPVTMEVETWTKQVENWCEEVGGGVYATQLRFENAQPTDLTVLNRFWTSFKEEATQMGLQLETRIYPGGTDARFLRELNIPAFGFSPICDHPVRLHDADEYLSRAMFLRGIDIYMRLITALGDSS